VETSIGLKLSADQNSSVRLERNRLDDVVGARGLGEGSIESAVTVQSGNAATRLSPDMSEFASDQDFAVGLKGDNMDRSIREGAHVECEIGIATGIQAHQRRGRAE